MLLLISIRCYYGSTWETPANVLESLWKGLATLVMLVWVEMRDTVLILWPGLAEACSGVSLVRNHVERQEMGQAPHLHCDLQFGGPEYLLCCDFSLGHPDYFRSGEGDSSSWFTNRNAEIRQEARSGSLWSSGELCPQRPNSPRPPKIDVTPLAVHLGGEGGGKSLLLCLYTCPG